MAEIEQSIDTGGGQAQSSLRGPEKTGGSRNGEEETSQSASSPLPDRGFLLPTLLQTDSRLYGRWDYLARCWNAGELPEAPIPSIEFCFPEKAVRKMLTAALDAIPNAHTDSWRGWSSSAYFLEWLLYGLHHPGQPELPVELMGCEGAGKRLAETLDLARWQSSPYDYLGDLLAENAYGKRQGFFPTPHTVCEMMARVTMGDGKGEDTRTLTVCDPCVGTGRLLLHASNFSLRLYGMEIDPLLCQATLVNGYLFAPWMVRPLPYLDGVQYQPEVSGQLAEAMAAQAPPHIAERIEDTVHDGAEQWRFEPIKKRRNKNVKDDSESTPKQGRLF